MEDKIADFLSLLMSDDQQEIPGPELEPEMKPVEESKEKPSPKQFSTTLECIQEGNELLRGIIAMLRTTNSMLRAHADGICE